MREIMFKKLLLFLILLPVLCFSQYEWTDKGDYKYLKYDSEIRQILYSSTGDSLFVSGKSKLGFFDADSIMLLKEHTQNSELIYKNSISSDLKSYILYDLEMSDSVYIDFIVYAFANNKIIEQHQISYLKNNPYYSYPKSQFFIEYDSKRKKLYENCLSNYNENTDIEISRSYFNNTVFSNNMNYAVNKFSFSERQKESGEIVASKYENIYNFLDITNNKDKEIYHYLHESPKYKPKSELEEGLKCQNIAFSNDEKIVAMNYYKELYLYNTSSFELIKMIKLPSNPKSFGFTNNNSEIIIIDDSNYLLKLNTENETYDRLIKIEEISDNCKITVNKSDVNKIAIASGGYLFINEIDFNSILEANFITNKQLFQNTDTIQFQNQSRGLNLEYFWEFGDGTTSTETNPKHIYKDIGTYSIKLTVKNHIGTEVAYKEEYITVVEKELSADFNYHYSATSYPIELDLYGFSNSQYNFSKWIILDEDTDKNKDTTSYMIYEPGTYIISFYIENTETGFFDIKTDTLTIQFNHSEKNDIVNETYVKLKPDIKTYNIICHNSSYYCNAVYDTFENNVSNYSSVLISFDKNLKLFGEKKFTSYYYPPYEPILYKNNLLFKYDADLMMNDVSYLYTDLEGNVIKNYSETFDTNNAINHETNRINTLKIKEFHNELYILSSINLLGVRPKVFKIKDTNDDNLIVIDSLQNHMIYRAYDCDFHISESNMIYSFINHVYIKKDLGQDIDIKESDYSINNKVISRPGKYLSNRINGNYFTDTMITTSMNNEILIYDIQSKKNLLNFKLSSNSSAHKIIRKGDSLYIAGSNKYQVAFYIYNFKTKEIDSVILENRIGEFTDLCFNEKGNLVLFGKLNNYPEDYLYIAEYDFDLSDNSSDNSSDTSSIEHPEEPPEEPDDTNDLSDIVTCYPNPITEELSIRYNAEYNKLIEIHVLDITGRELFTSKVYVTKGNNKYNIALSTIAPGVYLLNIKTDKGIISRKFVKE
jgi:PKD repeat protein